jgi:hypothetical protein
MIIRWRLFHVMMAVGSDSTEEYWLPCEYSGSVIQLSVMSFQVYAVSVVAGAVVAPRV